MRDVESVALDAMNHRGAVDQFEHVKSVIEAYAQEVRQATLYEMAIVTANRQAILDEIYNPENRLPNLPRDGGESQWRY